MAAMPATGLAGGRPSPPADEIPFALFDLSQLGEALGRDELPVELLLAGALLALAVGILLTLLVATLRQRRHRSTPVPDSVPAESSENALDSRSTLPSPAQDAHVFRPTFPAGRDDVQDPDQFGRLMPSPLLDAAQAEAWAAREAMIEAAHQASGWPPGSPPDVDLEYMAGAPTSLLQPTPAGAAETTDSGVSAPDGGSANAAADAPPTWERADLPLPYAAIASIVSTQAPRADIPSARPTLGTPEAPRVVELHDERERDAHRRVGPNLPLVAAIGTIAVGVAFSVGAAVGATLGVGAGAAIGLAFAGGAGVAIGATVALLGGGRR